MTSWPVVALGSVLPFKYGKNLPERKRSQTGEFNVMSSAGPVDSHDEPLTSGPCVVIGRKGTIGATYFCPAPVFPIDTTFFVEGSEQIDIRFAYYLLQNLPLRNMNNDSAIPGLNRSHAESLQVALPAINEQRVIAATLGALDDKIDSNRRIIPGVLRLIRAKVDQALSYGFEERPVSSLAFFVNGGAFTKGATGSGRMVLRIAELNRGPGPSTIYNDIDVPLEKLARPGDILMSWSGSLGLYRWTRAEAIINQHIFKVIPKEYPAWLVFDRVNAAMPVFQALAADRATTMGHIQRGQLDTTTVPMPSTTHIKEMHEEMSSLWERLLIAEREVHLLEELRQALLPELLSGRIRVGEFSE